MTTQFPTVTVPTHDVKQALATYLTCLRDAIRLAHHHSISLNSQLDRVQAFQQLVDAEISRFEQMAEEAKAHADG